MIDSSAWRSNSEPLPKLLVRGQVAVCCPLPLLVRPLPCLPCSVPQRLASMNKVTQLLSSWVVSRVLSMGGTVNIVKGRKKRKVKGISYSLPPCLTYCSLNLPHTPINSPY